MLWAEGGREVERGAVERDKSICTALFPRNLSSISLRHRPACTDAPILDRVSLYGGYQAKVQRVRNADPCPLTSTIPPSASVRTSSNYSCRSALPASPFPPTAPQANANFHPYTQPRRQEAFRNRDLLPQCSGALVRCKRLSIKAERLAVQPRGPRTTQHDKRDDDDDDIHNHPPDQA